MQKLRVCYIDHYKGFNPATCRVTRDLMRLFHVELVGLDDSPEILVYGDFGEAHWSFKGKKVYLTGENMLPDFNQCDLAFTPVETPGEPRAVRLPYYAQVIKEPSALLVSMTEEQIESVLARKGFCSFVVSNPRCPERNRAFKALNRLQQVSSGGGHFNNLGSRISDKLAFLAGFRFDLAFENSASPGYVTEKLVEPLMAGCIPIYWGAPDVTHDFNPARFIHARDFDSCDELARHVVQLDKDPDAMRSILRQPIFKDNRLPAPLVHETVCNAFAALLACPSPGIRRIRRRRIREHVRAEKGWWQVKWEMLSCKTESALWRMGWRR